MMSIDNRELMNGDKLKEGLVEYRDYVLVSEKVWSSLTEWFINFFCITFSKVWRWSCYQKEGTEFRYGGSVSS